MTTCSICKGDWFPTKDTHRGPVCSDCREVCAWCQDWIENLPTVEENGKRIHASCLVDAIQEAEQTLGREIA